MAAGIKTNKERRDFLDKAKKKRSKILEFKNDKRFETLIHQELEAEVKHRHKTKRVDKLFVFWLTVGDTSKPMFLL